MIASALLFLAALQTEAQTAEDLRAEVRLPEVLPIIPGDVQAFSEASLAAPPVVHFPEAAEGIEQGIVAMACIISESGTARKCIIESEEPQGVGFGAEALAAAPTFQFNPRTLNGTPLESVVRFRVVILAAPQEPQD